MDTIYKIYKLTDPISNEIRYIGVTTRELKQRFSQHKHNALKKSSQLYVHRWIRKLYENKILPEIELIENCTKHNWEEREKYWIKQYENLTNISIGGKGIIINREETSIERSANGHKKRIVQLDKEFNLLKIWDSVKEATDFYKLKSRSTISNCLKDRVSRAINYFWVYENDWNNNNFSHEKRKEIKTVVYQYSHDGKFIKQFSSISEALIENKIKYCSSISMAAKKNGYSKGYYWSYYPDTKFNIWKIDRLNNNFELDKSFYSYEEIAMEYNMDLKNVKTKFNNDRQNLLYIEKQLLYIFGSYWKPSR